MADKVSIRNRIELMIFDSIQQRVEKISDLKEEDIRRVSEDVLKLVYYHPINAQALLNVLLFKLERETTSTARSNIVNIISKVVLGEFYDGGKPHFAKLVKENISAISHATDFQKGKVREYLHGEIAEWITKGIVPCKFLKRLEQEEKGWKYGTPRPDYGELANESPSLFNLVVVGLTGPGSKSTVDMVKLMQQSMATAVEEGWLGYKNGHYVLKDAIEESSPYISNGCSCGTVTSSVIEPNQPA